MEEVQIVVRRDLTPIIEEIRKRNKITGPLTDSRIEENSIIFTFSAGEEKEFIPHKIGKRGRPKAGNHIDVLPPNMVTFLTKRRKKGRRNRMRTRGWRVVTSFTNSLGQKARIYEPFVEALKQEGLSKREQIIKVEQILLSNKNKLNENSINYFLNNTIEYLHSVKNKGVQ